MIEAQKKIIKVLAEALLIKTQKKIIKVMLPQEFAQEHLMKTLESEALMLEKDKTIKNREKIVA